MVTVGHQKADFECTFTTNVVWTFNGGSIPSNAAIKISKLTGYTYITITNVIENNEGNYKCSSIGYLHIKEAEGTLMVINRES